MGEGFRRPTEAFRRREEATAESRESSWTKEEIQESIGGFFEQLDAHETKMRQRMEEARQEAIRKAGVEAEEKVELNRRIQEEAERQRLRDTNERYDEMLAEINLKTTFEYIQETRPETADEIIRGAIRQLQAPQEE